MKESTKHEMLGLLYTILAPQTEDITPLFVAVVITGITHFFMVVAETVNERHKMNGVRAGRE